MQNHTLKGIEFALPRGLIERAQGSEVASLLALADAGSTEIDVLGEVLVVESRRQQPHNMHARDTAVILELFRCFTRAHVLGQQPGKLSDNEAQLMRLFQMRDLSGDAARILYVLLAMEHLPDRFRLRATLVPDVDRENERCVTRVILEDHFGR